MGNTALIMAVNSGHEALADLLFDAGVEPGLHEAAAIGDLGRVTPALEPDAGATRRVFAGRISRHLRWPRTSDTSRSCGADRSRRRSDRVATHRLAVTPLHAALFGRQVAAALLLIERGADVTPAGAAPG